MRSKASKASASRTDELIGRLVRVSKVYCASVSRLPGFRIMANLKTVPDSPRKPPGKSGPNSGTQYPYFDLNDSIEVAKVTHERGGGTCGRDLVAAALKYGTSKSGGFSARLYAAKTFGLINLNRDVVSVTDRATRILHPVMPEDEATARVEAFLAVPLFQKIYDKFKGVPYHLKLVC